jgi:predicted Co/Zn/Cd cation transporter (cation efflux family)
MRTVFKLSAVGLMLFSAAGIVAVFRAPFTWRFRLMIGTVEALAIYFGWLLIRLSNSFGIPVSADGAADGGRDVKSMFREPLVRRAIFVLLAAGALMVATMVLEIIGVLD